MADAFRSRRQDVMGPVGAFTYLFTLVEAAKLLRVSPSLLRKLVDRGHLDFVDVGTGGKRIVRFTAESLEQFIASRSRTATRGVTDRRP